MAKKNKITTLVASVSVIIIVLAIGLIAFSYSSKKTTQVASSPAATPTKTATVAPTASVAGQVAGEQSYVVQAGDTLFMISKKYNVKLDVLAAYNNLADPYPIKIGQTIKIPPLDGSGATANANTKAYTIDLDQLKQAQTSVDEGHQPWRLDPLQTAQAEVPSTFGITNTDEYKLTGKDLVKGEATVSVVHNKVEYTVLLVQPIRKGESGVWAVKQVSKKT